MANYFQNAQTTDEIKSEYRRLAMANHPDRGGDVEIMKEINLAYAAAMDKATRSERPGRTAGEYADMAQVNETIRQAIEKIIGLPEINIEICGAWVWVSGNTYPVKAQLKDAGYWWASKKKMWYFAGVPSANRHEMTIDEIRANHGSQFVKGQRPARALPAA